MEGNQEICGSNPTVHNNNKNNNNNTNSKQQHSGNNANSNPKIVISSSSSTATLNDNVNGNGNSNNIGNSCSSLNTNININNNTSHTSTTSTSSNNNHITVDTLDQHQQLISLPETVGGAAIFLENDHHNSLSTTAAESTNFVAIPLSERPPVICISQDHHQQQHNHHHHQHDNYSESLTRSASCLLRLRRCCIKLFSKIMGSNNPSEVDRYEYYDCKYKTINWNISCNLSIKDSNSRLSICCKHAFNDNYTA
uniref:Uncharacterized protein n=1 Tax=Musca domestica TaxID=7370 RepID=A0A1I8NDU4_MUSDO